MENSAPIRAVTRLTMLGQVAAFGWVVPTAIAGFALRSLLGHVSAVVLYPLGWQLLLGVIGHGALVLVGNPRTVTSLPVCLAVGLVASSLVVGKMVVQETAHISEYVDPLIRITAILLLISLLSASFGWFLSRRELRRPSLG